MFASKKSDVFVFRERTLLNIRHNQSALADAPSRVSLFVDGAAVWTFSKRMQRSTTCPAYIGGSVVTEMAVQCKSPVNHQKRITDVVLHADTEEKIERHAETAERNHIRHAVHHIGLLADVVDHSYEDHDQEPDIRQK